MSQYREIRRKDRALSIEGAIAVLREAEYGVLSLNGDGGVPYGVPLSFIWLDDCIYFHSAMDGYKADCIRKDARASFAAVCGVKAVYSGTFTTRYQSAIAFGEVREIKDLQHKERVLVALCAKYLPERDGKAEAAASAAHTALWALTPQRITGKGNSAQEKD